VSVLVVAQSSSEIPEGLMNNPVNLTVMEYIDRKGESRIINKYVKILFSNFHK